MLPISDVAVELSLSASEWHAGVLYHLVGLDDFGYRLQYHGPRRGSGAAGVLLLRLLSVGVLFAGILIDRSDRKTMMLIYDFLSLSGLAGYFIYPIRHAEDILPDHDTLVAAETI